MINLFNISDGMRLKNLFFVNVLIVLLCFTNGQKAFGQEVEILNENFESYYDNTTSSSLWTGSSEANCSAKIENSGWNNSGKGISLKNIYDIDYFYKYAEWNTNEIDISAYEDVNFSIDAAYLYGKLHYFQNSFGNTYDESYTIGHMIIEYQIDGGSWSQLTRIERDKSPNTYTKSNISGSRLKVRAKSICSEKYGSRWGNRWYYEVKYVIDNFIVKGTIKSEPLELTISALSKASSNNASDASISFKVNGGNAPYTYWLIDRASNSNVDSGSCDEDIDVISSSMSGGDYRIAIRDNSGREIDKYVYIYKPSQISSSNSGNINECSSSSLSTNEISVTDPHDHCIDFSGTDNHLLLADKTEINTGNNHPKRTIMFWFKTSDINSQQFLYKEGGGTNGLSFYIKDSYLYVNIWKNKVSSGDMKTNLISPNKWHHVALVWDESGQTDQRFKSYIDGNLINSLQGVTLINHPADIWFGDTNGCVMQDNTNSSGNNKFKGQMDDFKLWNEPLTEQQVRDEMGRSSRSPISNLIVQYDFNDDSGSTKDISGNSYNFTGNVPYKSLYTVQWENGANGFTRTVSSFGEAEYSYVITNEKGGSASGNISVVITDANKFMTADAIVHNPCKGEANGMIELRAPCAMHFDGNPTKQRIDCGSKFMDNLNQFTMEGWVRFDINDMSSGRHSFFGQDDTIEFGIYDRNPNQFHIWSSRGGGAYFPLSIYPNDLKWHHFALVGTGTQYIFYVDGKLVGTPFTHTNIGSGGYGQGHSSSNNVFIGGSVFDGVSASSNSYNGDMYKIGFWNRALSATELESIFENNTDYTGSESGLIAGYNFYEGEGNSLKAAGEDNPHTATIYSASGSSLPQWDAFDFLWNTGATTKKIENLSAGTYSVDVELSEGCKLSRQYTITEPATAVSVVLDAPANTCTGQLINISASVTNGTDDMRYFFFEGNTQLPKSTLNTYEKGFIYDSNNNIIPLKVKVVDKNGCSAESVIKELHVYPKVNTQPIQRQ